MITHPPDGIRNFSEWAKKQPCWKWLSERELQYGDEFENVLTSPELSRVIEKEVRVDQAVNAGIEVEVEVHRLGSEFWTDARNWARERGLLSPIEMSIIEICATIPKKMPSAKQCAIAISALKKMTDEGFSGSKNNEP